MTACEVWFGIAAFMENTCTLSGAQSSLLSMYSLFASSVLQINPRTEEGRKTELKLLCLNLSIKSIFKSISCFFETW